MEKQRNVTNAAWIIAQPLLLSLVCLPATAYIIRTLGPRHYGEWAVGNSLVAATSFLMNPGLTAVFVRAIAQEPETAPERLADQLGLRGLLGTTAGIASVILCLCLRYPPVVLTCVAVSAVGLVLLALGGAALDVLHAFQRLREYALVNLVSGFALTVVSVVVMGRGAGPVGLSVAYLTGPAVSLLLLLVTLGRQQIPVRIRLDARRCRALLREARSLGALHYLSALRDRTEQLLVPKLIGVTGFGYFSAGLIPADRLTVVPDGLMTSFYPAIAKSAREEAQTVPQQVTHLMVISLVACVPIAMLGVFLAPTVARLLFPQNAAVSCEVMRITIWSIPMLGVLQPMSCAMRASGRFSELARAGIGATLSSAALAILLIWHLGILGACWSWVARPALVAAFLLPGFIRAFPPVLPRVPLGRILTCTALMALPLWYTTTLAAPALPAMSLGLSLAILTYLTALFMLRVVER